jgi:hypothetical protein
MRSEGEFSASGFGLNVLAVAGLVAAGVLLPFWLDTTLLTFLTTEQRTTYFASSNATVPLWLGVLSWIANIAVAVVAWHAVSFAKTQAHEARRQAHEAVQTRAASLLFEIRRAWDSEDFASSRAAFGQLIAFHQQHATAMPAEFSDSAVYIAAVFMEFRKNDKAAYTRHTRMLDELELIGVLCRTRMIDVDHVMEIFGGQVTFYRNRLKRFCLAVQDEGAKEEYAYPRAIYANALWLFDQVDRYRPFEWSAQGRTPSADFRVYSDR